MNYHAETLTLLIKTANKLLFLGVQTGTMLQMSRLLLEGAEGENPQRPLEKSAGRRPRRGVGGRTDVCDLCLTPPGISATDNLIEPSA